MTFIDFGFIFDIAPGGITFESSPFKLTTEMVQVMGGGADEQAFNQFSQLVVKAYLACRPYASQICQLVTLMLESGLPCFKGETIQRMQNRFQLGRSERAAADFIMLRIKDSCENRRTVMYDYFQKLTNGKVIPSLLSPQQHHSWHFVPCRNTILVDMIEKRTLNKDIVWSHIFVVRVNPCLYFPFLQRSTMVE